MKKDFTYLACVIDRSGSMETIKSDSEGGFNRFIKEQKSVPGECRVTLAEFDNEYNVVYENVPIAKAKKYTLVPRNTTALLDAVGTTIDSVGKQLSAMKEDDRPDKVIFIIVTDGLENASTRFKKSDIKEMIEHQTSKYNWQFVYLGANQNTFEEAANLGIRLDASLHYNATAKGVAGVYACISNATRRYRKGDTRSIAFDNYDAEDEASKGSGDSQKTP